jgi:hypothetical protein
MREQFGDVMFGLLGALAVIAALVGCQLGLDFATGSRDSSASTTTRPFPAVGRFFSPVRGALTAADGPSPPSPPSMRGAWSRHSGLASSAALAERR